MNSDVRKKWVVALRSGEFEQGILALHEIDGGQHRFCCLGVLCEVAIAEGVDLEQSLNGRLYNYDGIDDALPVKVREWAGIATATLTDGRPLANLNDYYNLPFNEIADLIEEEDVS